VAPASDCESGASIPPDHKISETWKIPADLLVRPYKIERAA
jgi:hypothetical protein